MLKRKIISILVLSTLYLVVSTASVKAEDVAVVCPQPYGGGVVCGVETHVPVATGIGDNLAFIGGGFLGASGLFAYISKRFKKAE